MCVYVCVRVCVCVRWQQLALALRQHSLREQSESPSAFIHIYVNNKQAEGFTQLLFTLFSVWTF